MARRANHNFHPVWILIILVLLLALAGIGRFFFSSTTEPFRHTPLLDPVAYLENSNSLRGATYKVEGKIQNRLAWTPNDGILLSLELNSPGREVLPILVPAEFNNYNLQKNQEFIFEIEVDAKGILKVKDLKKL